MNEKPEKLIDKKGLRLDGRKADELRPVKIEVGILANADGSAYIEHGKNKILAAEFGPKEMHPKHLVASRSYGDTDVAIIWHLSLCRNVSHQHLQEERLNSQK
jgi:ribonuclease PH